jgi:hypothetical protein
MIECWKPVLGYEDLYQVSDRGRVRRIAGGMGACLGRILRRRDNGVGYRFVTLYKEGKPRHRTVHSLVTEAFLGPRPDGLEVNHKNGVRRDNRLGNLEYVTRSENMRHAFDVLGRKAGGGGGPRGEDHYCAKLTEVIVKEIRRLHAEGGISRCELARRYGVSDVSIGLVLRRKTWAHVA